MSTGEAVDRTVALPKCRTAWRILRAFLDRTFHLSWRVQKLLSRMCRALKTEPRGVFNNVYFSFSRAG
jgi:hypothetical protein